MNRIARSALTLTAGLALALVSLPARADDDHGGRRGQEQDRDGQRDRDGRQDHDRAMPAPQPPPVYRAPPVVYRAPPVVHAPPVVVYAPRAVYPAPAAPIYQPIRPAHWNGGWQSRELQREYRQLEEAREQFYAGWRGNPVRRDRFEAWYGARRAELDRRRSEPQRGW